MYWVEVVEGFPQYSEFRENMVSERGLGRANSLRGIPPATPPEGRTQASRYAINAKYREKILFLFL